MAARLKVIKKALALSVLSEPSDSVHTLLELNQVICEEPELWVAHCARGQVNLNLNRFQEALSDYSEVLARSQNLNERNKRKLLAKITFCSANIAAKSAGLNAKNDCNRAAAAAIATYKNLDRRKSDDELAALWNTANRSSQYKPPASIGRIAQIGKYMLDHADLQKIGRVVSDQPDTKSVRRHSVEQSEQLKKQLRKIDAQPGVIGSCVITREGFVLASTLPPEYSLDAIIVSALNAYLSGIATGKIGVHRIRPIALHTAQGHAVVSDFMGDISITLANEQPTNSVAKLTRLVARLGTVREESATKDSAASNKSKLEKKAAATAKSTSAKKSAATKKSKPEKKAAATAKSTSAKKSAATKASEPAKKSAVTEASKPAKQSAATKKSPPAKKSTATKKSTAKKSTATKTSTPAKKSTATKTSTAAKKSSATKKSTAKKYTATKTSTPEKKSTATKTSTPAKKSTATKKSTPAKKSAATKKSTAAKKSTATKKSTAAKKSTATKKSTPAKKSTASKISKPAKKSTGRTTKSAQVR